MCEQKHVNENAEKDGQLKTQKHEVQFFIFVIYESGLLEFKKSTTQTIVIPQNFTSNFARFLGP